MNNGMPAWDCDSEQLGQQILHLLEEVFIAVAVAEVVDRRAVRILIRKWPGTDREADRGVGQAWQRQHTVAVVECVGRADRAIETGSGHIVLFSITASIFGRAPPARPGCSSSSASWARISLTTCH